MQYKLNIIKSFQILCVILVCALFLQPVNLFANSDEAEISNLLNQFSNLLNRRNEKEINKFISFYIANDFSFQKKTQRLDSDNKVVDEELLTLNKAQYSEYLKAILLLPKKYLYTQTVNDVKNIENSNSIFIVEVASKESAIRDRFIPEKKEFQDYYVESISNCNFTLEKRNSIFLINSINCFERIDSRAIIKPQS